MSMFLDARSFIDALARQIAHQEYDGFPLKLQIAFPDRASFDKHVRLGGITVQEVGGGAVLVHYRGCRIPHLYYPPAPGNYEPVYLRHALRGILPSSEHDTLLKGRNIDHVFPRTAAIRNRIGFVLLLPCDAGSNKSAGGGVEKRQSFD